MPETRLKSKPSNGHKLTLAAFAELKKLPVPFLRQAGVVETRGGIGFTYFTMDGAKIAVKERTAPKAKDGSRWPKDLPAALYGAERLDQAHKAGFVVFPEGESDVLTLWHHGIPAAGPPGSGTANTILAEHVEALQTIYVVNEQDKGGPAFVRGVKDRLSSLGFRGKLYEIGMPGGMKDPSDLHIDDPARFKDRFGECLKAATPIQLRAEQPEWTEPVPLEDLPDRPPFPTHRLPAGLREWVEAEAEATQTPPDLAALLVLAGVGAGIARKFRVQVRAGYTEPTNIFGVGALEVGERKSAVFSEAIEPIQQHEREEQERMAPLIAEAASERRIMEARLRTAEASAAKAAAEERRYLVEEAKELAKELENAVVPEPPVVVCDDETPESLGRLLALHGGRAFVAAAEGTSFEIAKGRYAEGPNLDVFLKGHAGDELRVGRVSREREHVVRPALSMALAVQPDVIRGLAEDATMRQRGFLARFAYSIPHSRVGRRTIAPRPVPPGVRDAYHKQMLALWRLEGPASSGGAYVCHILKFSPEADAALQELERWVEPKLAAGEELSYLAGWAQKMPGLVARLAGILHMAEAVGAGQPWQCAITRKTVENAVAIGRDYFLPHAKAAFCLMGADVKTATAAAVWATIVRRLDGQETATVTLRDIHQWCRRSFQSADEVPPVAKLLCDHGHLREQEGGGRPGRGSKSPAFAVNPLALVEAREQQATRTHCTQCTHSEGGNGASEYGEDSEYTPGSSAEGGEEGEL